MGCNTSPARIEFPARFLDEEIRKCLEEHEDVEFKDGLPVIQGDDEVVIDDGIFSLYGNEVCYGLFEELEDLLVKKGVPFDRHTSADWAILPCDRHFRPGDPPYDHEFILHPDTDDVAVNLTDIRTLLAPGLKDADAEGNERDPWEAVAVVEELARFLDNKFPIFPPLSDFVAEPGEPCQATG